MKIIHITAAYKPAYIYGGPTMSVAKLCEALVVHRFSSAVHRSTNNVHRSTNNEQRKTDKGLMVEVLTTTANGKMELAVVAGESTLVDGVRVTYFKRLTKDHTHFSPGLLWRLRRVLRHFDKFSAGLAQHDNNGVKTKDQRQVNEERLSSSVFRLPTSEQETTSPAGWEGNNDKRQTTNEQRPSSVDKLKTNNAQRTTTNEQRQTNNALIIHIHAWWNLVSILSCWVAKWYNVPVVLSPRGMLTEYTLGNRNVGFKSIIHWLIGKKLLTYCHIHATSEKEKEDILKFIIPKSITVIANLVELEAEREKTKDQSLKSKEQGTKNKDQDANSEYQVASSENEVASIEYQVAKKQITPQLSYSPTQQGPFKLIFLSRIEQKKGLELLFEALAEVSFDWSLTIAGSGEQSYVEGLGVRVERLGISCRINWVGQVKNEDKFKHLAEHDLMVLTSYNENFANVVIESLSVGTPVLLSHQVGLADYVVAKDLGWITTLAIRSIKESLYKAYLAEDVRQNIRWRAPQLIKTDFNDEALVKKYIELYEQVT